MRSVIPFLYLIPAGILFIPLLLGRGEKLPDRDREETQGIRGLFTRAGLYLCRKLPMRFLKEKNRRIRVDLGLLEPRVSPEEAVRIYDGDKIGMTLLVIFAGSILAFLVSFSSRQEHLVDENGRIARSGYDGSQKKETLVVTIGENGEDSREIDVTITERQYTKAEADALFCSAADALPEAILGSNSSLDEVRGDLDLVDELPGFPFSIAWKIGNYAMIHSDGKVQKENIPEDGIVVMLTAQFTYLEDHWEQEVPICLYPPQLTGEERWEQGMQEILVRADEATVHEPWISLPDRIGETAYSWSGKIRDDAGILLVLILLAAGAVFVMKDKDLEERSKKRAEELAGDYPLFVSRLTLYLGAGMTVRNIIRKLADDYADKRKKGGEQRFLYEELCRAANELVSGVPEGEVYEHFAVRCRLQPYIRLGTLLSQNLRRGNSALLNLLREESKKAQNERMDRARKRGEEAGTKLLMPMMLMLVVVMVVIMIPAFLSI